MENGTNLLAGRLAIFRINYKSDFILTLQSDAGWAIPFCIKFWTGVPSEAYYAGWDGTTYTNCAPVVGEPSKLQVQFDDHHLPIGELKYQIGYHFTVDDFPTSVEDEVINQDAVIIDNNGRNEKVLLDLNGETAPEIQFSLPAYANEAQRIANEEQRIENEQQRIENEQTRVGDEETRIVHEWERQRNEQTRITQDEARERAFTQMQRDSESATSAANDAATLANSKARLAQEKAEYAQQQGDFAKAQGETAQLDHTKAAGDHQTALADHQTAAADHQTAVADHQIAAADHQTAEADHTRAGQDHTDIQNAIAAADLVYDISKAHASGGVLATYADLSAALGTNGANVPVERRQGGMTIQFVLSSDNNYVQYRYMGTATTGNPNPFLDEANWQGVDDEPTTGSDNLVKSGGVINKFLYRTPTPNLFDISDFTVDKGSSVVYATSVEQGTISVSNSTSTSERFRINLPANDTSKTYTLTFRFQRNRSQTSILLYTSASDYQAITLDENGYGKVEGFTGGEIRKLGTSVKNLDGTVVFSEIVLKEDVQIEEYIKTSLIKHLDTENLSEELNETLGSVLTYNPQTLTDEQKETARDNIGAMQSILTEVTPFDYGIKDFYTGAVTTDGSHGFVFTKDGGTLNISHPEAESTRKTIKVNFADTITKPGKTYKVIFTIDKVVSQASSNNLSVYTGNTLLSSGSIENGRAEVVVTGAVNAIGFLYDGDKTLDCSITCVVNEVGDVIHEIVDTQYLEDIDEENLSDELREAINYGVEKKRIELDISAENVTQTGGRYCHAVGSKGIRLSGNGTNTITLSHIESVGQATIMTFGILVPWSTQNVASVEISCGETTYTIDQAGEDFRTEMGHAYRAQGDTYNRVTFYVSDTDIIITVTSEDDWLLEISDSIVLDDCYKKTPILIEYDGGYWNGSIVDGNDTFNQWEMHRRLNIPYGINISDANAVSGFNEYASLSVNECLAEIVLRYAGTTYYRDPEADLMGNINETFESLSVATRGVVGLGQSVYDKKLLRCLRKGGVKAVRNSASNVGGVTMKGEDAELIVCDSHFMNSKRTIPLYGLPVIAWCHGVGTVSDDDPNKIYYSSGTNVLALLKWLKQKEEDGLVELLSPSEFVERLKH